MQLGQKFVQFCQVTFIVKLPCSRVYGARPLSTRPGNRKSHATSSNHSTNSGTILPSTGTLPASGFRSSTTGTASRIPETAQLQEQQICHLSASRTRELLHQLQEQQICHLSASRTRELLHKVQEQAISYRNRRILTRVTLAVAGIVLQAIDEQGNSSSSTGTHQSRVRKLQKLNSNLDAHALCKKLRPL